MKFLIYFLFLFLLSPAFLMAQRPVRKGTRPKVVQKEPGAEANVYAINNMNGKWQESKRTSGSPMQIGFEDTMCLEIADEKSYVRSVNDLSFGMRGEATIDGERDLILAGNVFTIRSANAQQMVLQDQDFIRTFNKVDSFATDRSGRDSSRALLLHKSARTNMNLLQGYWSVYKKTAPPGAISDSLLLIENFTVSTISSSKKGIGKVTVYNGANVKRSLPASFSIAQQAFSIKTVEGEWTYDILESKKGSFVFGKEGGLVSYARQ